MDSRRPDGHHGTVAAKRHFTADEADALLETLRPLVERARALSRRLGEADSRRAMTAMGRGNGGGRHAEEVAGAAARLREVVGTITAHGVVLRDVRAGLLDFPATRDGRPVYLCWRLGEGRVEWWHDRETGFDGRTRLER